MKTTFFNLDQAISAWREALAQQPGVASADLRELEAHLRDGFAELKKKDLSDHEAFLIATRRVGAPEPVAVEFAKAAPQRVWTMRAFWMVFGALIIHLWQSTLSAEIQYVPYGHAVEPFLIGTVQIWNSVLGAPIFYVLTFGLPVCLAAYALSRGRFDFIFALVSTRKRIAAIGGGLLVAAYALQGYMVWFQLAQIRERMLDPATVLEPKVYYASVGALGVTMNTMAQNFLLTLFLVILMIFLTPRGAKTAVAV